jgi:hypothetical protein
VSLFSCGRVDWLTHNNQTTTRYVSNDALFHIVKSGQNGILRL